MRPAYNANAITGTGIGTGIGTGTSASVGEVALAVALVAHVLRALVDIVPWPAAPLAHVSRRGGVRHRWAFGATTGAAAATAATATSASSSTRTS